MPTITATEKQILEALQAVKDPDLGKSIVDLGFVKNMKIQDDAISFAIELTTPACPVRDVMKEQARRAVAALGIPQVDITMTSMVRPSMAGGPASSTAKLTNVKNIIPVGSGKGGVGKSTVSANLALALASLGAKVGLLDADVYGPSIPAMFGVSQKGLESREGKVKPIEKFGVKIVSVGFLLPPGEAVIWRGPLLHRTMEQFLTQVDWGELDYLVLDLPPGTGDIQISICQLVPLTGAAIVSTPQDVALNVAEKAIYMFKKLNTPILGMLENMSYFVCAHCGEREEIFGSGGVRRYCEKNGIPFLGEIPLATQIRLTSDRGEPIVRSAPDSLAARAFVQVAENLAAQISVQNIGGAPTNRPEPKEISQPARDQVRIVWKDGKEKLYLAYQLRLACPCAACVDEMTGKSRIVSELIDKDVTALSIRPVGRYALQFNWSDGHYTGIYTFDYLNRLFDK